MDKARYLVEAHVLEGRSVSELAAAHGVHRSWIYKLLARYRAGGYEALEPRSRRRARASTRRRRRGQGERAAAGRARAPGHDAGAETLAYHLAQHHKNTPSVSTILRTLRRAGLVVAQRQKRPRCSLIRFHAELTNELWQADITAWQLASGEVVEILDQIDDHSRLILGSDAYLRVKALDVGRSFHKAAELHGLPASLLTDNGAVFVGSYRGGKVLLEYELERLGVEFKNSRPITRRPAATSAPDAQALPGQAASRQDARCAAGPARCLRPLLHNHIRPAQGAAQAHAAAGR